MKRSKLTVLALLGLGTLSLQAQNLNVKSKNGSQTTYTVKTQVKNLTFASGNLQVGKKTGGNDLYALNSLRALTFDYILTDASEIQKLEKAIIKVYPNPTSDILEIAGLGTETTKVLILNMQGQAVLQNELEKGKTSLSIASLENGLYFCKLTSGTSEATIKFVKK
jgi:hypothetical protein